MDKNDLLNRMEILFPDNLQLSDLRRTYVDRDLSSLFRVLEHVHDRDLSDLRKAVLEENYHAMFRILAFEHGDEYDDLRKSMLDERNIYSMFRVIVDGLPAGGPFALDLKKACADKNLHSLFRLVDTQNNNYLELEVPEDLDHNDVKKFVMHDNAWSMFRLLFYIQPTQIVAGLKALLANSVEFDPDSLSQGQLNSKVWLIEELKNLNLDLGTVFLCAGWYGILATLMFEHELNFKKIRSIDIDPDVKLVADHFNRPWVIDGWKFKAVTGDIHNIDFKGYSYTVEKSDGTPCYQHDVPDTVINTSCEHIENFDAWYDSIPDGTILILQSNDYDDIKEHVNTRASLYDFALQTPMTEELYSGELNLIKYTRFMRIGIK